MVDIKMYREMVDILFHKIVDIKLSEVAKSFLFYFAPVLMERWLGEVLDCTIMHFFA